MAYRGYPITIEASYAKPRAAGSRELERFLAEFGKNISALIAPRTKWRSGARLAWLGDAANSLGAAGR